MALPAIKWGWGLLGYLGIEGAKRWTPSGLQQLLGIALRDPDP